MRTLSWSPSFVRAYRRQLRRHPNCRDKIFQALRHLENDIFHPSLQTHKLSGRMAGLYAASCGYDCRIVFSLETDSTTNAEIILLIDIGTHDEVY